MALASCETQTNRQGRELKEHGTALFPIACYFDHLTVPWHWHDELEAVVVTEGRVVLAAGSEKFTLGPGEGLFINAGVLHAAWAAEHAACRFHSVVFHPRLVGGGIDSIFWQNYIQPLLESASQKYVRLSPETPWHQTAIEAIETAWQVCVNEPDGYEFLTRHALSQLVFLLSGHRPVTQNRPSEKALRDGERIKAMLDYIEAHFCEELSTAQIAKSAAISESECLRCFRNTIGATPIQYLKQIRIQKAVALLCTTEQKVAEIGAQCGFGEMSYFAKTFRELQGCTPSEYRAKEKAKQCGKA